MKYGFDLSVQEPDTSGGPPTAIASARQVMSRFSGSMMDQSIYGFGAHNPEPSPGTFDLGSLGKRLSLIEQAGGTPVISLVGAPSWMHPASTTFFAAPTASHYGAFATLCAHVAQSFPQVKYFVVWNELKGFFNTATNTWNIAGYTTMYNDVYAAIKKVRPTAMVGGPYAPMSAWPTRRGPMSAVHGSFGYVTKRSLTAVSYWLAHKVGADFVAVDGATENAKAGTQIIDAVSAAQSYSAVDTWIEGQTTLPIWWMESPISPLGWTTAQGAAARVATLAEMASSGASVGMQWQPQKEVGLHNEGLWTSTLVAGGGQATPLASALVTALPVLENRPVLQAGEPTGTLVVSDAAGTLAVNTTAGTVTVSVGTKRLALAPEQIMVLGAPSGLQNAHPIGFLPFKKP